MSRTASLLTFFLALLIAAPAQANIAEQWRRVSVDEETAARYYPVDKFIDNYYLAKPVDHVAGFLLTLQRSHMVEEFPAIAAPLSAFLGELMKANPDKAASWTLGRYKYSKPLADAVLRAFWLSGLIKEEKNAKLFKYLPDYFKEEPDKLTEIPVLEAVDIDSLWAGFFATGDITYTTRILDAACGYQDASKTALPGTNLLRQASMSLFENAKGHETVMRELKKRQASEPAVACAARLKGIMPVAPTFLGDNASDGEFSARLLLADHKTATALMDGPIGPMLQLPPVTTIESGWQIGILIFFVGIELKDDLTSDVEYDLTVTGPNGKPVDNGIVKGIKVTPVKRAGRYEVMHPEKFMALAFKDEYPAGAYGISITIRDNIGKKQIPLQKFVEFVKGEKKPKPEKNP